jgi:hypothetical protein
MAKKRLNKKKPVSGRAIGQARTTKASKPLISVRSAAAKKGWETRRRVAREEEEKRQRRSLAAKKAWAKRKASKKPPEVKKRRSEASKKGWEKRKAAAQFERREAQLEAKQPLLVRKDLRDVLPTKFKELSERSGIANRENIRKILRQDRAELRKLSWTDLIARIRSPERQLEAMEAPTLAIALKVAYKDLAAFWEVQLEKLERRQTITQKAVERHYEKIVYGTELEAYQKVDEAFRILSLRYETEETDDSRLRRQLTEAYATPQFDAIMEARAEELGWTKRQMYGWYNGSPDADLFL